MANCFANFALCIMMNDKLSSRQYLHSQVLQWWSVSQVPEWWHWTVVMFHFNSMKAVYHYVG